MAEADDQGAPGEGEEQLQDVQEQELGSPAAPELDGEGNAEQEGAGACGAMHVSRRTGPSLGVRSLDLLNPP
jgi:hypothetical protein